jgi:hypothetical protein
MDLELTPLQRMELKALTRDLGAVVRLVSGLRKYRAAVQEILSKKYDDGCCLSLDMHKLRTTVSKIENDGL